MTTAFVSGATGFIAQHLIKLLLSKNYKVVGSARSEAKGEHLKKLLNNPDFSYVVVPDLIAPGAFNEALKAHPEVDVFYHTASPASFRVSDFEDTIIKPAVEGTKTALKAVQQYGKNVTKFVYTSSYVAAGSTPTSGIVSEETWSEIPFETAISDVRSAYAYSKTQAERAVWDFVEQEKPHFKVVSVLPSLASGPQAFEVNDTLNASAQILETFLKLGPSDPLPPVHFVYFDVRDVAKAHLIAYESKEANNQRLLLVNGELSGQLIANIIRKNFPQLRESVPEGDPSKTEESLVRVEKIDNVKTRKILGFEPIDVEKSLVDTFGQILDARK